MDAGHDGTRINKDIRYKKPETLYPIAKRKEAGLSYIMETMEYSVTWLVSDSVKALVALMQLVLAVNKLRQNTGRNKRLGRMFQVICGATALIGMIFFMGSHDPLFMGWEFYAAAYNSMIVRFN
eukprot:1232254-Amorphochlora_amoeboformis.AAC.2